MTFPELDEGLARRLWDEVASFSSKNLLRLSILRDYAQSIHARKSKFLAKGKTVESRSLLQWEKRLESFRDFTSLEGQWDEFVGKSLETAPRKKRTLPQGLLSVILREKFERYDRHWEAALASEAIENRWNFWCFTVSMEIHQIEEWNREFQKHLWPRGLVLFVESSNQNSESVPAIEPVWQGRWIVVLDPGVKSPEKAFGNPASQSSTLTLALSPRWTLLYETR